MAIWPYTTAVTTTTRPMPAALESLPGEPVTAHLRHVPQSPAHDLKLPLAADARRFRTGDVGGAQPPFGASRRQDRLDTEPGEEHPLVSFVGGILVEPQLVEQFLPVD